MFERGGGWLSWELGKTETSKMSVVCSKSVCTLIFSADAAQIWAKVAPLTSRG